MTNMNMTAASEIIIPAIAEDGSLFPIEKMEAHRTAQQHLAISAFVFSGSKLLIQQRAAGKYHTPLLWANACCTHPDWGESHDSCVVRRVREELGVTVTMTPRGEVEYRADVGGGLVEHEVVRLYAATVDAKALALAPDPEEVAATRWIALDALRAEIAAAPERFTPWLRIYLDKHADAIFGGGI